MDVHPLLSHLFMAKAILFLIFDIALKVWANQQPDEAWYGWLYVCHNPKPVTIWTAVLCLPFAWLSMKSKSTFWICLLWAGVVSNTFERLTWGSVTDMIPIPIELIHVGLKSPVINLADAYLFLSSGVLLYYFSRLR